MWKFALPALFLGLAWYVLRDDRGLSPEGGELSPELVQNEELHRGMEQILARSERPVQEAYVDDGKRTLPSPDELTNEDPEGDLLQGDDSDRFRLVAERTHKEAEADYRRETIALLEVEIPRDEAFIKDLRAKGDHANANRIYEQLQDKYELLRKIQNEPEE